MSNILRRLRKLKTRLTDNCGLAPHSEGLGDPSAQAAAEFATMSAVFAPPRRSSNTHSPTASPGIPSLITVVDGTVPRVL
jgi:hypothetical protein